MCKLAKPFLFLFTGLLLTGAPDPLWAENPEIIPPSVPAAAPLSLLSTPAAPATAYFPILPFNAGDEAAPQLLPVASNHPLDGEHGGVTRAVIVIPDCTRDAGAALTLFTSLAGADNAATMILAPQFLLDADIARFAAQLPEQGKAFARWPLDGWEYGGDSLAGAPGQKGISSFGAMDLLLLYLGEKKFFPDLKQIVIVGNAAGGDFTQRYAATGQAIDILDRQNVALRFVVGNASSYLYFTPSRLVANKEGGRRGFGTPDSAVCPAYNDYPYGLAHLNDYARRAGPSAIQLRYVTRNIVYLVGEDISKEDRLPDNSCAALEQGPDRAARAANYNMYLNVSFGDAAHQLQKWITIARAGEDPAALFGSTCGMAALFGDGDCRAPALSGARNLSRENPQ